MFRCMKSASLEYIIRIQSVVQNCRVRWMEAFGQPDWKAVLRLRPLDCVALQFRLFVMASWLNMVGHDRFSVSLVCGLMKRGVRPMRLCLPI